MLKLIYYVPESHLELTKSAVFNAGAGGIGNYEQCAWQVKGLGQFKPKSGAQPFIGQIDQLETLEEWRVEMIVLEKNAVKVKQALLETHPYETLAFEFLMMIDI